MNIGFQEIIVPNFYPWHGCQCFMTTYMLLERIQFKTNNFFVPYTHLAPNLNNIAIKTHHRFCPRKFDCPCTLKVSILLIFVFFLSFVSSRFYCVTIRSKITHLKSIAKRILSTRDLLKEASPTRIEGIFGRKNMDH